MIAAPAPPESLIEALRSQIEDIFDVPRFKVYRGVMTYLKPASSNAEKCSSQRHVFLGSWNFHVPAKKFHWDQLASNIQGNPVNDQLTFFRPSMNTLDKEVVIFSTANSIGLILDLSSTTSDSIIGHDNEFGEPAFAVSGLIMRNLQASFNPGLLIGRT